MNNKERAVKVKKFMNYLRPPMFLKIDGEMIAQFYSSKRS